MLLLHQNPISNGLNPTVIGCRGRRWAEPHCYRLQRKEIGCYQVPCAGFPNPLCGGGKMDRLSCFTKLGMNITICTIPLQPITVGFSQSPSYAAYNSGVQPVSFLCSL